VSALGPLGFLVAMIGFGLRLDTDWQGTAWMLLVAGALGAGLGFRRRDETPRAFVSAEGGE